MAYIPDWEPLGDALKRVMATGITDYEAQTDLCRAVADRKIDVRVRVAESDQLMPSQVFSTDVGTVDVPLHLNPGDFDWVRSRPLQQWSIGPLWVGGWGKCPIDLLELSTAAVIEILCGGKNEEVPSAAIRHETAATKVLATRLKSNPQLTRTGAAAWCKESGYNVSDRGFQNRVWPTARERAGLQPKALPGRKPK